MQSPKSRKTSLPDPEKMVSDFLLHRSSEPILILNTDFTIVQASNAFLKTTGKPLAQVLGSHCFQAIYGLDAHCFSAYPGYSCPVLQSLQSGESARVIHEIPLSGKGPTYYNVVSYPIKNQEGKVIRIIEIWQDLTSEFLSRMESRSRQMKEDIRRMVNEDRMISLGKLAASCVHEINNPIQGLMTFSRLMENMLAKEMPDKQEMEDMRKYMSLMSAELERCGRIVSGLLSFARESPNLHGEILFNEVLQAVVTLTQHKMKLQNIRLCIDMGQDPLPMQGDRNQLQQCLLNLIFNAMEAMPQGGELHMAAQLLEEKIRIQISDTGCGIPAQDMDCIFDPFFTTKENGSGTGLGLSIVYGVVKSHGGSISVSSPPGKGACFTLEFPAKL